MELLVSLFNYKKEGSVQEKSSGRGKDKQNFQYFSDITKKIILSILIVLAYPAVAAVEDTTIIFIGGTSSQNDTTTLLQLKKRLNQLNPKLTWVIFTGNYSRYEMPGKNSEHRDEVEKDVRMHTGAVSDFVSKGGQVYFLAGHKDYINGQKGVRRLRNFINDELRLSLPKTSNAEEREVDFMPSSSCGDPLVKKLGKAGFLGILNTQWWMLDWEKHAKTNQGCDIKTRAQFLYQVDLIAKKYRTERFIFAQHHPLESLGKFGGKFSFYNHLTPPVFGSLGVWARKSGIVPQHVGHVLYRTLISSFYANIQNYGTFVFGSGHEDSLQLTRTAKQVQIIAGHSGGAPTWVDSPRDNEFAKRESGWAEVYIGNKGSERVAFFSGKDGSSLTSMSLPPVNKVGKPSLTPPLRMPTSPAKATYTRDNPGKTGFFKEMFLGEHYRDAYALGLDFDVLNLSTEQGGLSPIKIGGGKQTNSIRLVDSQGGQWAMRSTTKDSERLLPYPLGNVPFIKHLIKDSFTGTHPAAVTAIPAMAESVGIFHTKPRLMYLPDQGGLGDLRGYISDEVVLLERRPNKLKTNGRLPKNLGGEEVGEVKYISTMDVLSKVKSKPWKHHVDKELFLRARLFDLFLGDWDRHQDQWRFVSIKSKNGKKLYKPIPRDRDQAFTHYDGFIHYILRMAVPNARVLDRFEGEYRNIDWLAYNSRFVDTAFLNDISLKRWMIIAKDVKAKLTDKIIDKGFKTWPSAVYKLHGETIKKKLYSRRDKLLEVAKKFHQKVAKNIEILGSKGRDKVDITFLKNGHVKVELKRLKSNGKTSSKYFSSIYNNDSTEEIRIYSLEGSDSFAIHGEPHDEIHIRIIGGTGKDIIKSGIKKIAKSISIYDRQNGFVIDKSIEVSDERSKSHYENQYDFRDVHHEPTKFGGVPFFRINADEGLYLGANLKWVLSDFKSRPFSSSHKLKASLATTTIGADVSYEGLFPETIGSLDQTLEFVGSSKASGRNFFGFTNEFIDTDIRGRDFYRLRQSTLGAKYGVEEKLLEDNLEVGVKALVERVDVENTSGRITSLTTDINPIDFEARTYVGGKAFAVLDTLDNSTYPKQGIFAGASVTTRTDITSGDGLDYGNFTVIDSRFGTHIPFNRSRSVVLSTKFRFSKVIDGNNFPFYHAPTLGSQDIRSFNDEQLAGNGIFSHSTDLRFELFEIKSGLPGAVGIALSFDHGLAFGSLIDDDKHHAAVGGSVFWNVLDLVGLNVGYYRGSDDSNRITLTLGTLFSDLGSVK